MPILPLQLARVSNTLRSSVAHSQIARTQQSLLEVQNQLSTGRKLNAPSDNPGDAAVAQQIRKLLEQRQAYATNLTRAGSHLSEVDSTLGDLTDLLQQAQTIASANVGSDVTPDARASAATVIDSIYRQLFSLGNRQLDGVYLFAGDRATDPPFVQTPQGIQFVGDERVLSNAFDENAVLPFMVDGNEVFGALSTRVQGSADLSPAVALTTRIADLRGATDQGVRLGAIRLSNGTTSAIVDLSGADSLGDIVNAINRAGVGGITAAIAPSGTALQLSGSGADDITVSEIAGGTTAADLGILRPAPAGAGVALDGADLRARITPLATLASLRAGAGIDATGLSITNGAASKTIDLSTATTVEDLLNAINGSGAGVRAQINAAGTGIDIVNPAQGAEMTIAENGGTTAEDLGVRSFSAATALSELNNGKGVRTAEGADLRITDSAAVAFDVELDGAATVQDVLDRINAAAAAAGAGVAAGFAASGNGIVLTDTAGGAGALGLIPQNYSNAAEDLGLAGAPAAGNAIAGRDVNAIRAEGVFAHVAALREALQASDQAGITAAAEALKSDYDRAVRVRGQTGARIQEIESRQSRLEDQNVATRALLSSLEDVDITDAVARFQTLQTALQATLQSSARMLDLSLLDFLG